MALTDEEKAQLAALTAKENEPDASEDWAVEIWDETGAGAKVPFSQAKSWLSKFGIGIEAPPADDSGKAPAKGKTPASGEGQAPAGTANKYFGKSK